MLLIKYISNMNLRLILIIPGLKFKPKNAGVDASDQIKNWQPGQLTPYFNVLLVHNRPVIRSF